MLTRQQDTGPHRAKPQPFAVLVLLVVMALVASACSSKNDSKAKPTATQSSASTDGSSAVAAAKAVVEKAKAAPTTLPIVTLPTKPAPGGTIDVIACSVPSCQTFADIVQDAVKPLGWKVKFLNAGLTTKEAVAAYDQAVRDKPTGVIGTGGYDPVLFAKQLEQLDALHIPVFMQYAAVDKPLKGLTGLVYGQGAAQANGALLGNAILADSNGKGAHVVYVGTPEVANNYKNTRLGARTVLEKAGACSGCTGDNFDMTLAQIGTTLPGLLVSYLRAHPDVNYVVGDFGDIVGGFPQAFKQAGLDSKVKILANGVGSIQAQYLKGGTMLAAAYNPNLEILWTDAGAILASAQGLDLKLDANSEYPQLPAWLITKDNVVLPPESGYAPMVENYQSLFRTAWKIS